MRVSILLLFSFSVTIFAQTSLPDDAIKLKQSYTDARDKALKPLNDKYVAEMNKLLAAHTKAGNLEAALAIKEEITKFAQPATQTAESASTVAGKTGQSKKLYRELAGSTWATKWYDMTLTLTAEGGITFSSPRPGNGWRWKVTEDGELLISQSADSAFRNAKLTSKQDQFVIPFGSEDAKTCIRKSQP